ncbi:MAG: hypothetical protein MJZ16_13635, partial [Bacteroidales bacterium]|nr:hypothetical protein [Bacteroidales bacterium]
MEKDTLVIIIIACCLVSAMVAFLIAYIVSSARIKDQRLKIVELATDLKAANKLLEERQRVYDKTISELKQTHKSDLDQQIRALKSEVSVTAQKLLKNSQ